MRPFYWLGIGFLSLLSLFADHRKESWEKTDFVWNIGLMSSCDKGVPKNPFFYFAKDPVFDKSSYVGIKKGDFVWVKASFLKRFQKEVLPYVTEPFVLVVNDGDESFPSNCGVEFDVEALLQNDLVLHVFAQNNDYKGKSAKVSPIPIGIDFHSAAYKKSCQWGINGSPRQQENELKKMLAIFAPTAKRLKRAFVDFQHSDTMHGAFQRYKEFGEDRREIFQRLLKTGLIDYAGYMNRVDLWKRKGKYAFSISPPGNGLDCHRTWEDLVLGCIVIVKTSPINSLFKGLPVVIVQDWSEVTADNLEKWLLQYGDAFTNPSYREKLTNRYWISQMEMFK